MLRALLASRVSRGPDAPVRDIGEVGSVSIAQRRPPSSKGQTAEDGRSGVRPLERHLRPHRCLSLATILLARHELIGHRCALIDTDLFSEVVEYSPFDPSFRATMKYTPTLTVSRHSILIHLFQKTITTPIRNLTEDCHALLSQACVFPILKICVHPVGYFHIQRGSSVSCSRRKSLCDRGSQ